MVPPPVSGSALRLAEPELTSGTGCLSQRASGFFGGRPWSCGATPRGGVLGEGEAGLVGGQVASRVRLADQDVAAARLNPEVGAVAVEVLALPGEIGERVEELAVVGAAGAEGVVDRLVAGRDQDLRAAEAEPVELRQGDGLAFLGGAGKAGCRFGEQPGDRPRLLAGDQRACLFDPRFARRDQAGELGDGGGQLDRVGAQRRQGLVEVDQRGVRGLQRRREVVDRAFEVLGLRRRGRR